MKKSHLVFLLVLLLFACKSDKLTERYYMEAVVDDISWISDEGMAGAQLDYSNYAGGHNLWVGGSMEKPLGYYGISYRLGVTINSPVTKGKFYFNNNKYESNVIHGVSGNAYGYGVNGNYVSKVTTNGFVEITLLTDNEVGGTFEFDAVTYNPGSNIGLDTMKVRRAKFLVPIVMVSGREWKAP